MDIIPKTTRDNITRNEVEIVQQEQQEYFLLGSFFRTRGLRLFCYNQPEDKLIEVAPEKKNIVQTVPDRGKLAMSKKESREHCLLDGKSIPFEALNPKTAQKRVEKYKAGKIKHLCNLVPDLRSFKKR
jgi:hypothetical protein